VKRIDKLTPEQAARMPEWRDRWIKIGLSTEPADWERFERGCRAAYQYAGLAQPKVIVRVPSPIVLAFAAPMAALIIERVRAIQAKRQPGGAVDGAVGGAVGGAVDDAVRGAVRGAVDGAVDDAVGGAVRGAGLLKAVGNAWGNYFGGQFWVGGWYWYGSPSMASFFLDVCGLELSADICGRARAYEDTASSACWWWPHKEFVMVSDRPAEIHRNEQGRLHNEAGPSVRYRDGWSLWHIGGVRVDEQIVMRPQTQTVAQIKAESNAEVKRIRIERYGWEQYMLDAGAKKIDARRNDIDGTDEMLCRCDEETVIVLHCRSTARRYVKRVPKNTKTCEAAQLWMSGGLSARTVNAA
jgi:hypothetical protein